MAGRKKHPWIISGKVFMFYKRRNCIHQHSTYFNNRYFCLRSLKCSNAYLPPLLPRPHPLFRSRCISFELKCLNVDTEVSIEVKSLSHVRLFATPLTVVHHAPPSMGLSRQKYWSGLPFPSPEDLPDPGIEPRVSHIVGTLPSEPPGKA